MIDIPQYLDELIERHYSEGMLRQIVLRTPSAQLWNSLSPAQQDKWRLIVKELGEDPENYLAHMRRMLPGEPIKK